MRATRLFIKVLLLSIFLTACQFIMGSDEPKAPAGNAPTYPNPTQVESIIPQTYPDPTRQVEPELAQPESAMVYPEISDGEVVYWNIAIGMILSGQVTQVVQTHDLKVFITLKDGRTVETTEPAIDEVMQLIETCGDPCKEIRVATE